MVHAGWFGDPFGVIGCRCYLGRSPFSLSSALGPPTEKMAVGVSFVFHEACGENRVKLAD
eukprot:2944835-Amphidinium_carterae.1